MNKANAKETGQDHLTEHQKHLIANTPRMRNIENREEKLRMHQDGLLQIFVDKYTELTKQMVVDYKRMAINTFLVGRYCSNPEYKNMGSKHRKLIERALYNDQKWYKLRKMYQQKKKAEFMAIDMTFPYSI